MCGLDFQIILLPKDHYWEWLSACRHYVQHYGVNLTNDVGTAARYMKPRQVITFPEAPNLFAEGDIKRWLEANHDGVRLDPVPAAIPAALEVDLARRIKDRDRYAQKRKPFYLLWPTEYAVITQKFGANPQIYSRFGFPGHEGIDFRARTLTNIFCCADGEVFEVHLNPDNHAYGIHVRVRHAMGYRTIYAHFDHVLVREGEKVAAGQVLGKADSTGASTGSHLHLTLKQDGASERGETTYPKDVLDPTPFLVWPEEATMKSFARPAWEPEKCLIGIHGRIGGAMEDADFRALEVGRFEAVKVERSEPTESLERILRAIPGAEIFVRLHSDFSQNRVDPELFIQQTAADVGRFFRAGVRYFELGQSPNYERDGWGRTWNHGGDYAAWFLKVLERLKAAYPDVKLGFPGLSSGGAIPGLQADSLEFLRAAEDAVHAADWVGVNVYWRTEGERLALGQGMLYEEYLLHYPDKMIVITECGNPAPGVSGEEKSRQIMGFLNTIRRRMGVAAAFLFPLSATSGYDALVARREDGNTEAIIAALGERVF